MQVHVIRAKGYSVEQYEQVMQELNSVSGLITFQRQKNPVPALNHELIIEEENVFHGSCTDTLFKNDVFEREHGWDYFFDQCQAYREEMKLADKDLVVLLTPEKNSMQWLATADDVKNHNIFIKTSEWPVYMDCDTIYPTTYVVMSQVLQALFYSSSRERALFGHHEPLGCMNDFCPDKSDVVYKLRTADICSSCLEEMLEFGIPQEYIIQALNLFERLRKEMLFKKRHAFNLAQRTMRVMRSTGRNKGITITFPEINKQVKLNPKQSTLYLFYLNHPEGVLNRRLKESNFKDEIADIYYNFCEGEADAREERHKRAVLCMTRESGSIDPEITRLRNLFKDALGDKMAEDYIIHGLESEGDLNKGIRLNRALISYDQSLTDHILGKHYKLAKS